MIQQQNEKYIFVTGCAGFIGFHLSLRLLYEGYKVLGIDNLNDYYDQTLKYNRLEILKKDKHFTFIKGSVENLELLDSLFNQYEIEEVIHLAAQAGVRYSLENPHAYIQSNLVGFANILDCCKQHQIKHLIYASSSSVYGSNKQVPFSVSDRVDQPISLYAATKKANELMAHTYSHLYSLPTTGLRFFTVYGPWGRPDMAYFTFSNAIIKQEPLNLFNYGNMRRDFTYIDDVIESIYRLIKKSPPIDISPPYKIFNIGNHQPVQLHYFIQVLEDQIGMKAIKNFLPIQPGDVQETFADIEDIVKFIDYRPKTNIEDGLRNFVKWFKEYYNLS
ncbi:NAD-dependent epimerase [Heyndrickxia camelliae]|uniref:Protein CapI n=1 Tax=Heyndrickxia camelliae TaxID=1707093 RepID=A0A2N3LK53_9BACI|nr:NAD-dependent epimerase [Heyndrickxia camelliae]PKR84965.1 protein CapI [Heyndrickxia camelliae]